MAKPFRILEEKMGPERVARARAKADQEGQAHGSPVTHWRLVYLKVEGGRRIHVEVDAPTVSAAHHQGWAALQTVAPEGPHALPGVYTLYACVEIPPCDPPVSP